MDFIQIFGKIFNSINNIIWILKGIYEKGLYDQTKGMDVLFNSELNQKQLNSLKNYFCCVYNITKQKIEYINVSHPLIKEYICASASLWIIFKPKLIQQLKSECQCNSLCNCFNDINKENIFCNCTNISHRYNEFMDGGILKPIPFEHDMEFEGKYLIMTTKDIDRIINKKFLFNFRN